MTAFPCRNCELLRRSKLLNHELFILLKPTIAPSEATYIIISRISPNIETVIVNTTIGEERWGNHPIVRDVKLRKFVGEAFPSFGTHSTDRVIQLTIPNQKRSLASLLIANLWLPRLVLPIKYWASNYTTTNLPMHMYTKA
jgi:hypothetical protein